MGIIQHKTLTVTTHDSEKCLKLMREIKNNGFEDCLGSLFLSPTNVYVSFVIYSCGSKLNWDEEKIHQENISSIIKLIEYYDWDDGSNPFSYIYISYGDCGTEIIKSNCKNKYE